LPRITIIAITKPGIFCPPASPTEVEVALLTKVVVILCAGTDVVDGTVSVVIVVVGTNTEVLELKAEVADAVVVLLADDL
jgi:hypothetical protein